MSAKIQRLRVSYARDAGARYISHLDTMRFWERALRRARAPVSYSEGFTPHAQIALAAPLPVGLTSRCELMDVFLSERLEPDAFRERLQAQLPPSLRVFGVEEVDVGAPSLQSQVRTAEYRFSLAPGADLRAAEARIHEFLAAVSVPWEQRRENGTRRYDLRPLVVALQLERQITPPAVLAVLRAEEAGTARPDQVAEALGIAGDVLLIERLALNLAQRDAVRG